MHWRELIAGALTGLIVGLTGAGGGALMTPILLLIFGMAPATAVGTDLWFAAITKVAAVRTHHGHGLIDWQVVKRLWAGSLPASALMLMLMEFGPIHTLNLHSMNQAISAAVMLTSVGLLFQNQLHRLGSQFRTTDPDRFKAMQKPLTVAAGACLGVLVTLTSVGAGAIGAVLLVHLYPLRLTPPRLVATDIAHAIPLAMFAGLGHLMIGNVNFGLLGYLLCGSIPGVMVGAALSARLPHGVVRVALAAVLMIIGIKLW